MSSSGRHATNRPSRQARQSKGEFASVAQANGGIENMINWEGRTKSSGLRSCADRSGAETDQDTLALIKYIADEGSRGPGDLGFEPTEAERRKLEKILENPSVIKTPVVRNGKQSTLGYQPEVWKGWS